MNIKQVRYELLIEQSKVRSPFDKGVYDYAFEILNNIEYHPRTSMRDLHHLQRIRDIEMRALNGCRSWHDYSFWNRSLTDHKAIIARLIPSSELIKDMPYKYLFELQAYALTLAYKQLIRIIYK